MMNVSLSFVRPDRDALVSKLSLRQTEVQHQAVEDVYRLFQLFTNRRHHRREDFHDAWRPES